jgi:alkylation response protein AidB-like acyl-CoA dehydrogenase
MLSELGSNLAESLPADAYPGEEPGGAWRDMRLNRIGAGTDEIMLDVIGRSYGL